MFCIEKILYKLYQQLKKEIMLIRKPVNKIYFFYLILKARNVLNEYYNCFEDISDIKDKKDILSKVIVFVMARIGKVEIVILVQKRNVTQKK